MKGSSKKTTVLTTKVHIQDVLKGAFADWQAQFNAVIAIFPGFISLEFFSPYETGGIEWIIIQRFQSQEHSAAWRESQERKELIDALQKLLGRVEILEEEVEESSLEGGVTEVFITQVSQENDASFRKWLAKIHRAEAQFPGFRGVYVQSPSSGRGRNWITLLQFDTTENLDRWLDSPERAEVIKESTTLISAFESHRVVSSYAGWFSSIAKGGELPPVWKQTMLVLLILYPIVMCELKFLLPWTRSLGTALATFIGNTLSVSLISWPLMPIAIGFLGWWLSPRKNKLSTTLIGTGVVILLYLLEIVLLGDLLGDL